MIWIVMILVFIVDQLSKYYVSNTFHLYESVTVIPKLFKLVYVHNYGAAFGILQNQRWLLILVSFLVVGIVVYFYQNLPKDWLTKLAIGLAMGGNIGNLVDRMRLGYVVDFFELPYWPVFNVADMAIVVGMILLAWKVLFDGQKTGEIEDV